jgi:hypothetical protein
MYTVLSMLINVLLRVLNFMLPAPHGRLSGDCYDITVSSLTLTAYCPTLLREVICNNRTQKSAVNISESFTYPHVSRI